MIGNRIINSADKGISVGEDSSPIVFANLIDGCVRGIEADKAMRDAYDDLRAHQFGQRPEQIGAQHATTPLRIVFPARIRQTRAPTPDSGEPSPANVVTPAPTASGSTPNKPLRPPLNGRGALKADGSPR